MKRKQSFLIPLLMAIVMMAMSPTRMWAEGIATGEVTIEGTGTAEDPYLISNVAQLEWFRDQANATSSEYTACAKLVNDIDLSVSSNSTWTPIKESSNYAGTFDGNGHTVKNMVVEYSGSEGSAAGFFGRLAYGSVVKNLTVEGECNANVSYLGMIAGYSEGATITNCTAKGGVKNTISGELKSGTGGILGYGANHGEEFISIVVGCVNYADVSSGRGNVGGILGYMFHPVTITKCVNAGSISGDYQNVGGILGYGSENYGFTISDCANYGDVTTKYVNVAGLVGLVSPKLGTVIKNCYVGPCAVRGSANTFVTALETSGSTISFSNIVYSQDCKVYTSSGATSPASLSDHIAYGTYNTSEAFVGVSATQIAAGEATYLLNGAVNGGTTWTQDLSQSKNQPAPLGNADLYGVYLMGYAHGATARSFSNDANKKNSLHPAAADGDSHDAHFGGYTSNGNQTHDALCNVCGYTKHDEACDMVGDVCSKCLYELLSSLQLADGAVYTRTTCATAEELIYTRTFADNDFNCLYVPFEVPVSGFTDCSIYAINMFQQHDMDNDGVVDDVTLEVIKAPAGATIMANHPYLIRYDGEATGVKQTYTFDNVPLAAASTPEYRCSSMNADYVFRGSYTDDAPSVAEYYTLVEEEGKVVLGTSTNGVGAQRWYMTMTSRDSQFGSASGTSGAKFISIIIAGEDNNVTGIVNTNDNFKDKLNGKYIENGKLVIVRNGRKYNVNGKMIE